MVCIKITDQLVFNRETISETFFLKQKTIASDRNVTQKNMASIK